MGYVRYRGVFTKGKQRRGTGELIRRYKRRSRHCATVARSFTFMEPYWVMFLTTTAHRSKLTASRLMSSHQSPTNLKNNSRCISGNYVHEYKGPMMDFILHGYCGLYCSACPIMLNTKTGAGTEQCCGCKSKQPTGYCAVCSIRACARGKRYEFCNEYSEYSTCQLMQKFLKDANWPYQQIVPNNMESIRQNGLVKWLDAEE